MNAYAERANLQRGAIRFIYEGQNVTDSDTPMSLEMEEGDTLEVFKEQLGGGGGKFRGGPAPLGEGTWTHPRYIVV